MISKITSFLDKVFPAWKQFIKFGVVGLSNTFISLAVYYMLVYSLNLKTTFQLQIANLISYFIGFVNAVFWNFRWVFKEESSSLKNKERFSSFLKFLSTYMITFTISALLLTFWVDFLKISGKIAPLLSLFITVPMNFFINKFWTFKNK